MPRSPTGRYCDSPPRSPRRYDKYSYALKRRPEGQDETQPLSPTSRARHHHSAYEACVAGVAPLMINADGFAVAEDGSVQSRFISAPRYSAPSIAMVPVPMAVIPVNASVDPTSPHRVLMSPPKSANDVTPIPYAIGLSHIVPSTEVEAWKRLVMVAGRDFKEEELAQLNWETLTELLVHYKISNPIDIARIQLQWKRRQGMLPSDAVNPTPVEIDGTQYVPVPTLTRYPNAIAGSPSRSTYVHSASSPRRDSPGRYTPSYKKPAKFDHVSPKVDTGRRGTPGRAGTPTRRAATPTRR